jgi:hypothetical protein
MPLCEMRTDVMPGALDASSPADDFVEVVNENSGRTRGVVLAALEEGGWAARPLELLERCSGLFVAERSFAFRFTFLSAYERVS